MSSICGGSARRGAGGPTGTAGRRGGSRRPGPRPGGGRARRPRAGVRSRAAPRAPALPRSPPCPTGPRSSGGSSPIERSACVSSRLAAEVAHAQLLELVRVASAEAMRLRPRVGAARGRAGASGMAGHPIARPHRAPRRRPWPRSGTRAARAAGCARVGRRERSSGRPSRSRSEAEDEGLAWARQLGELAAPSRVEATRVPGSSGSPRRAGARRRAHARPDRLGRERVGAARAEDYRAVAEGVGGADDRADVAGVVHPVQVDHQRGPWLRPAPRGRRRSRACPSRACSPRRAARLHVPPARSTNSGSQPALRRLHQVLPLGHEQVELSRQRRSWSFRIVLSFRCRLK